MRDHGQTQGHLCHGTQSGSGSHSGVLSIWCCWYYISRHPAAELAALITQGQWGVTAAEEEEENRRVREFQDSIPKMCSQLRILTHFYQVRIRPSQRALSCDCACLQMMEI